MTEKLEEPKIVRWSLPSPSSRLARTAEFWAFHCLVHDIEQQSHLSVKCSFRYWGYQANLQNKKNCEATFHHGRLTDNYKAPGITRIKGVK